MRKTIDNLFFGKNSGFSALLVLAVLSFIILGCKLGGRNSNPGVSNNSSTNSNSSSPTPTPTATPKPEYKKADASKKEMPSDAELQEMTKKTLLDFNESLQNEDFTEFYSTICKPWKNQTDPEKMKVTFQDFINKKIDISSISSLDADFSPEPVIEKEIGYNTLKLSGTYPTSRRTEFTLNYIPEGKAWKLSKIEVRTYNR